MSYVRFSLAVNLYRNIGWLDVFKDKNSVLDFGCIYSRIRLPFHNKTYMAVLSPVTMVSAFPLWLLAGVKLVVNTSTRARSSMHVKRRFRMSCTWDCPSSVSTSNVLGVLLRLHLRWECWMIWLSQWYLWKQAQLCLCCILKQTSPALRIN